MTASLYRKYNTFSDRESEQKHRTMTSAELPNHPLLLTMALLSSAILTFTNFGLAVPISGQNADTHSEDGWHFSKPGCCFKLTTSTGLYAYTIVLFINLQFTLFSSILLTSIYYLNLYIYHMLCVKESSILKFSNLSCLTNYSGAIARTGLITFLYNGG